MTRRIIKTTANSRRGAKRAKTSPRDENRANAAKTKKSVFSRACPRAQTRRRPRKIQKTTQSRRAPRKTYEVPHPPRRGRQTPPRRPSRRPARQTRKSAKLLQTFCRARATRAGQPIPPQAADVSHTRRAERKKAETGDGLRFRHEFRIRPLIFLQRHVVELLVVASERAVVHSLAAVVGERDHHLYNLARKRHGAV